MDVVDRQTRSQIMARVRSTGNRSTELAIIKVFRAYRISGWRRRWPIVGKPDFVWPRLNVALFIDGCFWHGCPSHCRLPATNKRYWIAKIKNNQKRDRSVRRELQNKGWTILRVWEHEIKHPEKVISKVRNALLIEQASSS